MTSVQRNELAEQYLQFREVHAEKTESEAQQLQQVQADTSTEREARNGLEEQMKFRESRADRQQDSLKIKANKKWTDNVSPVKLILHSIQVSWLKL